MRVLLTLVVHAAVQDTLSLDAQCFVFLFLSYFAAVVAENIRCFARR